MLLVKAIVSTQTFINLVSSIFSTAKNSSGTPTFEDTLTEGRITTVLRILQRMKIAVDDDNTLDKNRVHVQENIAECVEVLKAATIARKGGQLSPPQTAN